MRIINHPCFGWLVISFSNRTMFQGTLDECIAFRADWVSFLD